MYWQSWRSGQRGGFRHITQVVAILMAVLAGCGDSPVRHTGPAEVRSATVRTVPAALVRTLAVRLDRPYGVQVDYWTEDGPRLRMTDETPQTTHDLVLARLRAGASYQFEVRSTGADGSGDPVTGSFVTNPLPDHLAVLDFTAEGTPSEPLTLLEIALHEQGFTGGVIVDGDGEVVWFLEVTAMQGSTRRENGHFVFLDVVGGLLEVTPTGEVVARLPQEDFPGRRAHHDVITTPGNTLLFIATDVREYEGRSILGEAIWEWDPDSDALSRRWSSWHHLSPDADWGPSSRDNDWLHANAIALGPNGNVLMSLRFTDQVISITPDFQQMEWRLGGIGADVQVSGSDVFVGQHTAAELPPVGGRRRILLFDNGPIGRDFSRAQELELDPDAGTAATVWEFRPEPDNFSFITSLARRLPNGNTFVAFGAGPGVLTSFGPVEAYEVDPSGDVQFHLEVGGPTVDDSFVLYRAAPISSIAGEQIVP
jgi:hypothetical protein